MGKSPFKTGAAGVIQTLEHLSYVQIDTLSVVERAHHHTLWNRVPKYTKNFLDAAVESREVFEYWFHAAAYLPMRDYRFALPRMNSIRRGESSWYKDVDAKVLRQVKKRITEEGPLKGRDFESKKKTQGNWWNWKPTKKALEKLYMQGDLMISRRDGMEKVYDLRERVLPETVNTKEPTLFEFAQYLVSSSLNAHGFSSTKQIGHLRKGAALKKLITEVLANKVEEGSVVARKKTGMPEIYILSELLEERLPATSKKIRILSPFDNAIIHRDRVEALFNFDYRIECYTPASKRKFGYFCLPVMYGDSFIAQADCKAHRASAVLEVISLYVEKSISEGQFPTEALARELKKFAGFNGCESVKIGRTKAKPLGKSLIALLE